MTILVVEDEPAIAASPDAITLDLNLGGVDSLRWLEALAASRPELARSTMVVAGRVLDDSETERVAACGAKVLLKPARASELVEAVTGVPWERRVPKEDAQAPTTTPTWDGIERRHTPSDRSDA